MATVRHRVAWVMGMKRKDVPEEDGALQIAQHRPDYRRRPLTDGRTLGRSREWLASEKIGMGGEVHLVSERKASATPASVTKVAGDPNGVDAAFQRGREDSLEVATADRGSVRAVVPATAFGIGIKNPIEFQCGNAHDKIVDGGTVSFHFSDRLSIRLQPKTRISSAYFLKNLCSGALKASDPRRQFPRGFG
jgi:hypothetical protein